jgi:uncharacterized membrane protein
VRRGLFLIGLGFAFNIVVWSPEDAFNWDILTLIGTGLIVLSLIRNIPLVAIALMSAALVLAAPIAQRLADYQAYWTDGYFDPDFSFADIFLGFFVTGYFPVMPWIAFPMIGFAVASSLFGVVGRGGTLVNSETNFGRIFRLSLVLMFISASLLVLRLIVPDSLAVQLPTSWTMFPPSLEYSVGILGFTIFVFVVTHCWIDQRSGADQLAGVRKAADVFGKHSLSFYLLHHLAHLWPLWLYGSLCGEHFHDYWMKATTVPIALLLAFLFLIMSFVFFRWIERTDGPTAEKAMRWLCD